MKRTLIEFARARELIAPGDRVLVALSGGADSVSLLAALRDSKEALGIELEAAHFDHHLRGASQDDANFCRAICEEMGVFLTVGGGDVAAEALRLGRGTEETARDMRYAFLEETRRARGMTAVATAHTADDELETVIMNLIRGGGARGLSGIPPRRDHIIRPMLTVTREMVDAYLAGRGLGHVEDETNASEEYARNRIRLRVVPVLRELNPRAAENAAKAALRLLDDEEFLRGIAGEFIETGVTGDEYGASMPAAALTAMPRPVAIRVLRELTGAWMDSSHVGALLSLAAGDDPSASISLPNGVTARRAYDKLALETERPNPTFAETPVAVPGITEIPEIGLKIICKPHNMGTKIYNSVNTYYLRRDMIAGNLTLRPRREGDTIKLRGRPEKSLKKLFIEAKVPARDRAAVPVLSDGRGVAAVIGFGPDERFEPGGNDFLEIEVLYEKGH